MTLVDKLIEFLQNSITQDCAPRRIRELCETYLISIMDAVEVYEVLDRRTSRARKQLSSIRQSLLDQGVDPWFEFNSSSSDYIQGRYYIEPGDSEYIKQAKRYRLSVVPIKHALKVLNFSEFEIVCAALLRLLGAGATHRTRHSRDQGIDFFGHLTLGDLASDRVPFLRFADTLKVWLVGQAKHYVDHKVSAPEIRSLVGSINLARFKEYSSGTELFEGLRLRSCDPIFSLFLTTGTFSTDANRLAARSGVVLKDIDQIARFLADKAVVADGGSTAEVRDRLVQWAAKVATNDASIEEVSEDMDCGA